MKKRIKTTLNLNLSKQIHSRFITKMDFFGQNIKYFRKQKGIKQRDLATALGISPTHIALIEKGERRPSVEVMIKICLWLNEEIECMFIHQRYRKMFKTSKKIKPQPKRRGGQGLVIAGMEKADMDEIMENFAENVRKERKEREFNLSELGRYVKITTSRLRSIEKGEQRPTFEEVINICDFLGEDIVEMLMPQRIHRLYLDNGGISRTKPKTTKSPNELRQEMAISMILELDEDELKVALKQLKSSKPTLASALASMYGRVVGDFEDFGDVEEKSGEVVV